MADCHHARQPGILDPRRGAFPYWKAGLGYAFIGIGVGFAGTPASHSLTGSVPVRMAGMASAPHNVTTSVENQLTKSFSSAANLASQHPRYA